MRELKPLIIYKYKSVSDEKEMDRLQEILVEKRIFFPTLKQLNDPMEACSVSFGLQIAGSGYHYHAGKTHPVIETIQEKYGILSFTAIPNSPIMWAHYGKEYTGCCLIFSSEGAFSTIEPTIYSNYSFDYSEETIKGKNIETYVKEALYYKGTDWAYENEWRYIEQKETDKIAFEQNDIKGIIVGEKMDQDRQDQIANVCKREGIPCFRTNVMRALKAIGVIPIEYKNDFITRSEVDEYMNNKRNEGNCTGDEYRLFNVLNNRIGWE